MVELQNNLKAIEEAGAQVVAISYDSQEILSRFADKENISFPLLSDPDSQTIKAYGILNKEAAGSRIDGVPYPGTFIVNQDGVIEAKLFHEGYRKRHQSAEIIEALKNAD